MRKWLWLCVEKPHFSHETGSEVSFSPQPTYDILVQRSVRGIGNRGGLHFTVPSLAVGLIRPAVNRSVS